MKSGHGRATLKIKLRKKTNWNCMFHNTSYWYVWGPSQQRTGQVSGMKMNQETGKWKEKKSRGGKEEEESERGRKWRSSLRSGGRLGHYITAAAAGIDNALSVFSHNNCLWTTNGYDCLTFFFFLLYCHDYWGDICNIQKFKCNIQTALKMEAIQSQNKTGLLQIL